jgi:hypothetical protein
MQIGLAVALVGPLYDLRCLGETIQALNRTPDPGLGARQLCERPRRAHVGSGITQHRQTLREHGETLLRFPERSQ